MKKVIRFENVDVLDALSKIVELHTRHYKEDFDLDKELIPKLALSPNPEDKHILWMSRLCGTHVLREQNIYLKDTYEHNTWKFYYEQAKEPILAYAVSLDRIQHGKVIGSIYPLNYASHVEHIKQLALPICKVSVTFEDGFTTTLPYGNHRRKINEGIAKHGYPCSMRYAPENKQELAQILKREHLQRERQAVPGDFHSYLCKLEQSSVHKQLRAAKSIVTTAAHLHDNKDMPEL